MKLPRSKTAVAIMICSVLLIANVVGDFVLILGKGTDVSIVTRLLNGTREMLPLLLLGLVGFSVGSVVQYISDIRNYLVLGPQPDA